MNNRTSRRLDAAFKRAARRAGLAHYLVDEAGKRTAFICVQRSTVDSDYSPFGASSIPIRRVQFIVPPFEAERLRGLFGDPRKLSVVTRSEDGAERKYRLDAETPLLVDEVERGVVRLSGVEVHS